MDFWHKRFLIIASKIIVRASVILDFPKLSLLKTQLKSQFVNPDELIITYIIGSKGMESSPTEESLL